MAQFVDPSASHGSLTKGFKKNLLTLSKCFQRAWLVFERTFSDVPKASLR